MNLWLVGMMGSGKSTVGALVATELVLGFIDTDDEVEARLGGPIADYWRAHGEAAFRREERVEIVRVSSSNAVVSVGGGAVSSAVNRATMMSTGRIVWLRAGLGTLESRLGDGGGRPLLDEEPLAKLLASREKVYAALADTVFDTDSKTPDQVAKEVVAWWVE